MDNAKYFLQDDSSHWYLVPANMVEEFVNLSDKSLPDDEEGWAAQDAFIEKFENYAINTGPENIGVYLDDAEPYVKISNALRARLALAEAVIAAARGAGAQLDDHDEYKGFDTLTAALAAWDADNDQ